MEDDLLHRVGLPEALQRPEDFARGCEELSGLLAAAHRRCSKRLQRDLEILTIRAVSSCSRQVLGKRGSVSKTVPCPTCECPSCCCVPRLPCPSPSASHPESRLLSNSFPLPLPLPPSAYFTHVSLHSRLTCKQRHHLPNLTVTQDESPDSPAAIKETGAP